MLFTYKMANWCKDDILILINANSGSICITWKQNVSMIERNETIQWKWFSMKWKKKKACDVNEIRKRKNNQTAITIGSKMKLKNHRNMNPEPAKFMGRNYCFLIFWKFWTVPLILQQQFISHKCVRVLTPPLLDIHSFIERNVCALKEGKQAYVITILSVCLFVCVLSFQF
jgi:hypothetical protein